MRGDVQPTALDDCPRFTERHDWAENWNRTGSNGPAGVPNGTEQEALTGTWAIPAATQFSLPGSSDPLNGVKTTVTAADGTYNEFYYRGVAGNDDGWRRSLVAMVTTFGKSNPSASILKQRAAVI